MDIHAEKILILDFGSQTTQLIARRVREAQVYCEIHPFNIGMAKIREFGAKGIILSGGPACVLDKGAPVCDLELLHLGVPVLGICYGMQLMTHLLGGEVERAAKREYGKAQLLIDSSEDLFHGLDGASGGQGEQVWMSHGDKIKIPPPGFSAIAHSGNSPVAAMRHGETELYGVQFHPEVVHTPSGAKMLQNFLFRSCGCKPVWTMKSFVASTVEGLRQTIGSKKVVCALSGGVDSSVVAVLLHEAVGHQSTCIFVNNGLLRQGEAEEVQRMKDVDTFLTLTKTPNEFMKEVIGWIVRACGDMRWRWGARRSCLRSRRRAAMPETDGRFILKRRSSAVCCMTLARWFWIAVSRRVMSE